MKERAQILAEAARLRQNDQPFALATVVKINGSTYRRPGARMLITPEGAACGTISGGCLEQEVAQQALEVLDEGLPRVEEFDLSDDDLILGFGIGCDGSVHVMIEPVPAANRTDALKWIERCLKRRTPGVIASVIDAPHQPELLGQRLLIFEGRRTEGDLELPRLQQAARDAALAILADGRPQIRTVEMDEGTVEMLFEVIHPPIHLHIFGGGHDVRPVVRIAKELGWPTTVVGRKTQDELADRFPRADHHVFLMNPEEVLDYVTVDARTPAVIMNHNYQRDKTLVHKLLPTPVPYVGALGPRLRTERIMDELQADDPALTEADFDKLHGPVGLDLGTETPQEIALAIIAEIQAVLHERPATKLRERKGSIHEKVPVS